MIILKSKLLRSILQLFCFIGWFFVFKKESLALLLSLTEVPEIIDQNQEIKVHFRYEVSNPNQKYYLRPCFYASGTNNYFGCIKNNSDQWVCGSQSDTMQYYEIETDSEGVWEGDLDIKADDGGGEFLLKIRRYTINGTYEDSNSETIIIDIVENSPTPSPTPSPESQEGICQINNVENSNGEVLKSVKIYVDGTYVSHYAPETLTFCDGCKCTNDVDCGFGEHTIKLEKSDYKDWSNKITIDPGETETINAVMDLSASPSPSIAPSPSPKISPSPSSKSSTKSSSPSPSPSEEVGEVLGETEQNEPSPSPEEVEEKKKFNFSKILPFILIIPGFGLLGGAGFYFYKETKKDKQELLTEDLEQ